MRTIWIILIALLFAACSQEKKADFVTISGVVENPAGDEVEIFFYTDMVANNTESVKVSLDENNAFLAELPLESANFVYVHIPRRTLRLFLSPGADIQISFDASDMDQMPLLTGTGYLESRFLLEYNNEIEAKYGMMAVLSKAGEKDPAAYTEYIKGIYEEAISFMEQDARFEDLDPDFVSLMRASIRYEKYSRLMDFPPARAHFAPERADEEIPDGFYDFLESAKQFSDDYLRSRAYVSFLQSYLNFRVRQLEEEEPLDSWAQAQFDIAMEHFSGKSRELVLAQVVHSALNFGDFKEATAMYEEFMAITEDDHMRKVVQETFEAAQVLAPGNPAPGFTLTDINGETVSLEDFRGQVVYLDFWASWCGPCMQQVPYAKELKARMAEHDDLVFLYISVDTDEAAWRRTVDNHEIQGVHLNVSGFDHPVPSSYNLRGVPTFYLIDREGMIFDNRPPRPNNERIDEVLLSALNQ